MHRLQHEIASGRPSIDAENAAANHVWRRDMTIRAVINATIAMLTVAFCFAAPPGSAEALTKAKVVVAFAPTSQGNGPQILYMKEHKLLEKYAREFGYDLEAKYLVFQSGVAITEGMVKGDIDFGLGSYLPMTTIIASGLPILPLSNIEGASNWVLVRPGSPIKSIEDLVTQKAKIATSVGTSSHYFLIELFRVYFGKSPEELGVTIINMPPSEGITFPLGVDAIAYWEAPASIAEYKVGAVRLVDEYGQTGAAHRLGAGANLFKERPDVWGKSLYSPESLVAYRVFSTVRKGLVASDPKLVEAFLLAQQEAVRILSKDFRLAYDLNKEYWPLPFEKVSDFLRLNTVFGRRDWIWLTYSDFKPVVWGSHWAYAAGLVRQPVTWEMVQSYLAPIAEISRDAYQRAGNYPDLSEMTREAKLGDQPVPDLRGLPVWMMDRWLKEIPQAIANSKK